MSDYWIVYLLFFTSASLLTIGGYNYYVKDRGAQKVVNRRLSVIETMPDRYQALAVLRRERGVLADAEWRGFQILQDWLIQTGLRLEKTRLFTGLAALSTAVTSITTIGFGFHPIALLAGILISIGVVAVTIRTIRARRIARFQQQLPDVLDIIVRSLRAGHPLPTALSLVARETPDPAGSEFGIAFDEVTYGLDVPTAMRNLARRVGDPDLLYVVTSIAVQSQSGGNLAEILSRLSKMMRERFKLRQKVRALSSEGRMSAILLTSLPFGLFVALSVLSPKYFGDVWGHPIFRNAMYVAGVLLVIGHFVMKRMVNFKY